MVIGVTYPTPVTVNGYKCRNCAEVDLAKRHVDPQHPRSGPYNSDAASDPTRSYAERMKLAAKDAAPGGGYSATGAIAVAPAIGATVDLRA